MNSLLGNQIKRTNPQPQSEKPLSHPGFDCCGEELNVWGAGGLEPNYGCSLLFYLDKTFLIFNIWTGTFHSNSSFSVLKLCFRTSSFFTSFLLFSLTTLQLPPAPSHFHSLTPPPTHTKVSLSPNFIYISRFWCLGGMLCFSFVSR